MCHMPELTLMEWSVLLRNCFIDRHDSYNRLLYISKPVSHKINKLTDRPTKGYGGHSCCMRFAFYVEPP